ncbi:UNVERIFIED_CONTAM: hypothetical protein H355_009442 [Colinus virginianus]|nr:hypothetical protein H355_009442 [Colinus virginianus]
MSVCGEAVGAGSLPSELVVHIFSFLAGPDRLRASAACSHWRECLFYPALWPRLRLSLRVSPAERPRLEFLMRKCGWFVRELRVQFAADNYPSGGAAAAAEGAAVAAGDGEAAPLCPRWLELLRTYLELVMCVLSSVRNNSFEVESFNCVYSASNGSETNAGYTVWAHNLIAIARLRGSDLKVLEVTEESIDFDQGELADQDVDPVHNLIEQGRNKPLLGRLKDAFEICGGRKIDRYAIGNTKPCLTTLLSVLFTYRIQQLFEEILGNSRQLKWLSCGFMLQIVTPTSLSSLSNPIANTMEHLSLLDNHIPGNTTLITAVELERFVNLRSLALDFCDFTAEMARVLADSNHVPLHRLSLLVHSVSIMHKSLDSMPEDENWKALMRNSTNLRVYIMAFDVKSDDMLRILKPSIPLERIHFDSYITCVSGAVVDLISRQYDKFLTHFILMNDVIDMSGFPDLSDNRNEDPLVLLAWRCTRLSLLAVHGYTVWAHNLIAIARLRGSDLKVLEVTEESIDFDQGELADQDVDPVHNLIEQVSLGLGRPWHAVMDIELLSVFTEPTRHFYREMQSFSEGI